ncbi:unnamed protein product, partial [Mesorhabditis belari]|uniref:Uncharacterized protein n=1 Tax=Mesorhabditis belari TaxID=2138241 RepID=A0AAF3EFL8_9BILA
MSYNIGPGQTMAEIYRRVINEVIAQMKETFLDENVDVDVLQQLKRDWENRVRDSGAVDLDGKGPIMQNLPPLRASQGQIPRSSFQQQTLYVQLPTTTKRLHQLDGNIMTDSSSEDEEIENDDPLHHITEKGDDDGEQEGQVNEEPPLNSDDDQSDDEDIETLFAAENVVVCQFEKVGRNRQNWKFNLKDGIMHINGRDYCFQKCTGEAEW